MTPSKHKLILVLALAGLVVSVMASYVHYQLLTDASYTSFCDVGDTMSCTQAYLSRYGSVAGVPVARRRRDVLRRGARHRRPHQR